MSITSGKKAPTASDVPTKTAIAREARIGHAHCSVLDREARIEMDGTSAPVTSLLSWLYEVPFWTRGIAVMSTLVLIAAVERVVVGAHARRWKEYGAWVVMSALGAGFGACNDLLTSRVSAYYFELGKGLSRADHHQFVRDVADLGARAGFSAGLVLGGALLFANTARSSLPSLRFVELLAHALAPMVLAAALAPIVAFSTNWDVQGLGDELRQVLSESDVEAFLLVQRAHAGAYIGAAIGTSLACLSVLRSRRARRARGGTMATPLE